MNRALRRAATRVPYNTNTLRTQLAPRPRGWSPLTLQQQHSRSAPISVQKCAFSTSSIARQTQSSEDKTPAKGQPNAVRKEDPQVAPRRDAQRKADDRPWQRTNSHAQPESTSPDPTRGSKEKGRVLTTPTRLLKLILPIPFHPDQVYIDPEQDVQEEFGSEKVEPLALLVHPQQPLSYLERLIQAEIPPLKVNGQERLPAVAFRAEADQTEKRGKSNSSSNNVASYSGAGREGQQRKDIRWVRWSSSTEVGDFIRDAARGREFAIDIEGHSGEVRVAVPSFRDRTHYMRMRLRRMSKQIDGMSKVKNECDQLAHKGAHRIAQGGFGALAAWWGTVYFVTFHTEMGWDLVEPVTYLAGLTTIMGGYLWFLYMSKDLSYKAAMNITVSRRQNALYQEKGFDYGMWEHLVHEANMLRRDIKNVAAEYDVDWDEMKDLGGEEVKDVLESEDNQDEHDDKAKKAKENEKKDKAKSKSEEEDD